MQGNVLDTDDGNADLLPSRAKTNHTNQGGRISLKAST